MRSLREITQAAVARGDEPAFLVYGDRTYGFRTFVETGQRRRPAPSPTQYGIGPGDRVAVLSQNNPEWCLDVLGHRVAAAPSWSGLNGWWKADEILYGLQDSGATVLVADRKRFERIADRLDEAPDLAHVFLVDGGPDDFAGAAGPAPRSAPLRRADRRADTRVPRRRDRRGRRGGHLLHVGHDREAEGRHLDPPVDDRQPAEHHVQRRWPRRWPTPTAARLPTGSGQTVSLLTSPLFHVSGCHSNLVVGLLAGIKIVIPEGRFQPDTVLALIQDHGVTIWATVPTMVWRVCEHPGRHDYDTSSVTTVAFGGSPSADELQRKVADTFPNVRSTSNAYGLTETSSVATVISGEDAKRKPWSVGPPVPGGRDPHRRPDEPAGGRGRDRRGLHPRVRSS